MNEGTWICPTCTLENSSDQLQCPVCFTPKPQMIRALHFAPSLRRRFAAKLFSSFLGVCFFSLSNTLSGYIFPTTPYIFDEASLQTLKTLLQTDNLNAEGLLNGLSLEEENALVQTLVVAWLQVICILFYLVFFQGFGDLLAKQSLGLYILQSNGEIDKTLKRELLNCIFTVIFPIDLFLLLLTERRLSDYVLGTQVVQSLPTPQATRPLMRSLAFAFALGFGCLATDLIHAYATLNSDNLLQNPTFSQGFESWDVNCPENFEFIREGWTSALEYRPSLDQGSLCTMQQYVGDLLELDNFYEIKIKIWAPPPTDRPPLLAVEHPVLLLEHVSLRGDRSPVLSTRPQVFVPPTLPGAVHDLSFQFAATESLLEDFPVLALSILRPASLEQSEAIRIYSISMTEHRTK